MEGVQAFFNYIEYMRACVTASHIRFPPRTLKPEDFNRNNPNQPYRPQLGFQRESGYRQQGTDVSAAIRMIR